MENVYYNKTILDLPMKEVTLGKQITFINSFNNYQKIECLRLNTEYIGGHLYTFSYSCIDSFEKLTCNSSELHIYEDKNNKFIIDNISYYRGYQDGELGAGEKIIKFDTEDETIIITSKFYFPSYIKGHNIWCRLNVYIENLENTSSRYCINYYKGIENFISYLLTKCKDQNLVKKFKEECNKFKFDPSQIDKYGNYSQVLHEELKINFNGLIKKIELNNELHFYLPILKMCGDYEEFRPNFYNKNNELVFHVSSRKENLMIEYIHDYFVKGLVLVDPITFNMDKRTCKLLYKSKTGMVIFKNGGIRYMLRHDKYMFLSKNYEDYECLKKEYELFNRLTTEK